MSVKLRYVFLLTMLIVMIQLVAFGIVYALFAYYLENGTVVSVDEQLSFLRIIISAILAGSIIFTVFIALFFVRETFMPIKKLGLEMQQISLRNISGRLDVGDADDEISGVARNFNGVLDKMNATFDFQKNFVFHASHEFRTPLAIMLSETESALSKELSVDDYKKVLVSLKEEQQELIELTNSLLLISQSEDMGHINDWPMLRIDEVVYDTISYAKKMLPDLSVDMAFGELPDNPEDLVIQGNERLLRSAFINLLKNAQMYSIDQKVTILLESSGDTIMVHFDNKGTQLPADEKKNLMLPFFRGSNALKTKGYGLGLPMVHRFVSLLRGTVVYTPVSNDINRFTITLSKASAIRT